MIIITIIVDYHVGNTDQTIIQLGFGIKWNELEHVLLIIRDIKGHVHNLTTSGLGKYPEWIQWIDLRCWYPHHDTTPRGLRYLCKNFGQSENTFWPWLTLPVFSLDTPECFYVDRNIKERGLCLLNMALGPLYIHEKGVGNRKGKGGGGW